MRYLALAWILMPASVTASAETTRPKGLCSLQELYITDGDDAGAQRLQITDRSGATVLDTDNVLSRIENAYSPHSYDGYIANLIAERQGKLAVTDLQGERHTLLSPSTQAGGLPGAYHPRRGKWRL